jgi:hypothetical protein
LSAALLDQPRSTGINDPPPASNLRNNMAAVRVSFTWLGTKKSLTPEQRAEAAQPFDAEGQSLSAAKKILDNRHPAFRAVTAIRGKIASAWKSMSLPFPEPGVRLIRRDDLERFSTFMEDYRAELADAVADLDRHYGELKAAACERLGRLFNPGDYPESLVGLFDVSWDFPSVEPPDYLRELNPDLYEQEQARVAARFDEAVRLAEAAFLEEFAKLVGHLSGRISSVGEDGKPKVFRDSAVNNLADFFEKFRSLIVRSNDQLDELVAQAQRAVRGVGAQDLRDSGDIRQRVATELSLVQSSLDGMMVERPRRKIIRPNMNQGEASRT